jgi:F0F1-type ATP synthase membrane subunit c/vacuolar-type H+-ATPase subunit K
MAPQVPDRDGLDLGLALGVAGFFAGPYVSVAAGMFCGGVATQSVQAGLWFRNLLTFDELRFDALPSSAQ